MTSFVYCSVSDVTRASRSAESAESVTEVLLKTRRAVCLKAEASFTVSAFVAWLLWLGDIESGVNGR